ncbi:MAG: SPFH domain-containing protein [Planctomycetota bacterium]
MGIKVGVVKSNVGVAPDGVTAEEALVVENNQRGIWREPYPPQKLYLNTNAYEITIVSTKEQTVRYGKGGESDYSDIEVRTSDGFTFPVDVRVEYQIEPENAPLVVARFGGDNEDLRSRLTSAVRDIFRNNAENVKALDYVRLRSTQGQTSRQMLSDRMAELGVTIKAMAIGDIGNEESLGNLLKTQKDREIAIQEQITIVEQQKAAERRKELSATEQEAEEERRLATARYAVQIAEEEKMRRITEASAEAESIRIKAEAQAEAYRVVAEQIGPANAALVELLKVIGEKGINITPRVMVIGENGENGGTSTQDAETTALIGTMLDQMIDRSEKQ